MWGRKKPDRPVAAKSEPKNLKGKQPPGPSRANLQGTAEVNKEAVRPTGEMVARVAARLGPNLHVKGDISGGEDLVIDGTFEGLIQLDEGKLTIGTTATVTADIVAAEVVVSGNVKGNVRAKNRIQINKDASVTGDLTTPKILIEDGAHFKGSIEIDGSTQKEAHNPRRGFSGTFPPATRHEPETQPGTE